MGMLKFPIKKVQELHDYAVKNGVTDYLLVKDHGVYLMPRTLPKKPPKKYVLYADGCHPDKNAETWYDYSIELVGGDDFFETLPIKGLGEILAKAVKHKHDQFAIVLTENSLTVATQQS